MVLAEPTWGLPPPKSFPAASLKCELSNEQLQGSSRENCNFHHAMRLALQNHGSANVPIFYYVFDVLILAGRDVMDETLSTRRGLLRSHVLPKLSEPIRHCPELNASLADVIGSVRAAGLEGVVAKRLDSSYEPGSRSGPWRKMRINQAQEFVIGGYTLGGTHFDALIFGCYEADRLLYVERTRNGSTPSSREQLFRPVPRAGERRVPLPKPPRGQKRTLGTGSHRRQDAGVPLAEAGPGRAVRVCGMDTGQSSAAFKLHRFQRRPGRT